MMPGKSIYSLEDGRVRGKGNSYGNNAETAACTHADTLSNEEDTKIVRRSNNSDANNCNMGVLLRSKEKRSDK